VEPRKQETMREWWAKQTPREKVEFAVAMAIGVVLAIPMALFIFGNMFASLLGFGPPVD
jgi:hypothetical protein